MSTATRHSERADWRLGVQRGPLWSGWLRSAILWPGLIALALFGLSASVQAQQANRIGFVDMQRLIDSAPQVAEARDRLAREFAVRDNLLKADEARYNELAARLAQMPDTLPPGERARLSQEAEALQRLIARTRGQLADELNARSREEVDKAWPEISAAVADFARENNYDLVVNSPVLYVSGRIDITDQVLTYLRARVTEDAEP